MKKRVVLLTMLVVVLFTNCGRGGQSQSYMAADYTSAYAGSREQAMSRTTSNFLGDIEVEYGDEYGYDSSPSTILTEVERKLVRHVNLRIRVDNLGTADLMITELINKYNGYISSSDANEYNHNYVLRVPSDMYDIFLSDANGIGKLISRSESTEDVTIRYYDLESQLESKRDLLRTFQSYLTRASSMEEILAVEYRIADLRREIDFTGTQLRNLANRVDYATIIIFLQGPSISVTREQTLGDRVNQLLNSFGGFLSTVAIVLLGIIIFGIPILALVILLAWLLFGRIGILKKLWKIVMVKTTKD